MAILHVELALFDYVCLGCISHGPLSSNGGFPLSVALAGQKI